jgi:quinol monooxygenase YgiN
MIIVEGWIRFAEGEIERLADVARTMVAETHKEAGCLHYAFARDLADPRVMRISERWVDDAALAAHFQTPHMAAFNAAISGAKREGGSIKSYTAELQRTLVGD